MNDLHSWPRIAAVRAVAAPVVGLLVACSDGYPTEDEPQIDRSRRTQPQLLAAMNSLGAEKHLAAHWQYALVPACVLVIRVRNGECARGDH